MYKEHFHLKAMPFSIAPDPGFFYMSNQHRDAWLHLGHAIAGDAKVVLLTGEVGAGKTTVCRRLVAELPGHVKCAMLFNPGANADDLLAGICLQLELEAGGGTQGAERDQRDQCTDRDVREARILHHVAERRANAQATLLIVDEAQGLGAEAIATLQRLCCRDLEGHDGLRLVLVGQPELNEVLALPESAAFDRSISMRYHLGPLGREDVAAYVAHRLTIAGGSERLIPRRLIGRLHRLSGGIPRVINLICDRALLATFAQGRAAVTVRLLEDACAEATGRETAPVHWSRWAATATMAFGLLAAGAVLGAVARPISSDAAVAKPTPAAVGPVQQQASTAGLDPQNPSDWPDGVGGRASTALAYAALLRRWDVPAAAVGQDSCRQAVQSGLMCVQGRDEIEALRRLDVPAVLQLVDRQGRQTQVALVQLRKRLAVLQVGGALRTVTIPVLESQWTRHYTVIWRPPAGLNGGIEPGEEGPRVQWVRDRLAQIQNPDFARMPARLDGRLKQALRDFQTLEGLPATGSADLRTLMYLASRTEALAPRLEIRQCEGG